MKKLLGDRVVLTTFSMILLTWGFSTCSAVTGVWLTRRPFGIHHLSPSEIKDFWHLPLLLTILWSPIIVWRAVAIRRRVRTPPAAGAIADRGPKAASGCFYIGASLMLFFGIAMACNFAGDAQRWRVGLAILHKFATLR